MPRFHTNQSCKIWHFGQHICLFLKVKTAYVSISSCLGSILHCFLFFRVSLPSGKGASYEPPTPPEISAFEPPLPLGISSDLPWGGGGMDIFWNHTMCIPLKICLSQQRLNQKNFRLSLCQMPGNQTSEFGCPDDCLVAHSIRSYSA